MAKETIKRLKTKGWKWQVWENIGWHFDLINSLCGMSIHFSATEKGPRYWCMMDCGNRKNSSVGSSQWASTGYFKNPNHAVSAMRKIAEPVYKQYVEGLFNLRSIFKD